MGRGTWLGLIQQLSIVFVNNFDITSSKSWRRLKNNLSVGIRYEILWETPQLICWAVQPPLDPWTSEHFFSTFFGPKLNLKQTLMLMTHSPITDHTVDAVGAAQDSHPRTLLHALPEVLKIILKLTTQLMAQSQLVWSFESQSRVKVKVVKWRRKKWNEHNLMYIY